MKKVSILNHVLGPVMRGPSSSHTAGSYHIGKVLRDLLYTDPVSARFVFDVNGSYAKTFRQQASDRAFVTGLMGLHIGDRRFPEILDTAHKMGWDVEFSVAALPAPEHPNDVQITLLSKEGPMEVLARSVGGGSIEIASVDGWDVCINGEDYTAMADCAVATMGEPCSVLRRGEQKLFIWKSPTPWSVEVIAELRAKSSYMRQSAPLQLPLNGCALADSAEGFIELCRKSDCSLSEAAIMHESSLLGLSREAVIEEMGRRWEIFKEAVRVGISGQMSGSLQLIPPYAGELMSNEGRMYIGGVHARAAVNAAAAMHACGAMEVVCAAPTGGAAGALPGAFTALHDCMGINDERIVRALFAAGAVGVVLQSRGTFAAEVAGCQVEIGAAGAMAACGVVDLFGGRAGRAFDAAAISFQNSMGSVCDPIGGMVEIPCHTRNAAAAASAFVTADLVAAGIPNPVPLDETVDAVMDVGRRLPSELRCTALAGISVCPSALRLCERGH